MRGARKFTEEEYKLLITKSDKRERCLIALGVRTGFRISELLSLNVEDVSNNVVYLLKRNTKGKLEGRKLPIHKDAVIAIEEYVGDRKIGPLFLSNKGRRISRISLIQAFKKACAKVGITDKDVSTHSMRKSYAANMYELLNRDIRKLQEAMGHRSLDSTSKYLSVNMEEIWNAVKNAK